MKNQNRPFDLIIEDFEGYKITNKTIIENILVNNSPNMMKTLDPAIQRAINMRPITTPPSP
jgi:hypothetical protein